ncbi:hypothetical protein LJC32_01380 [Oscillospiraceae bacterium OttesenSCG-928-F05]|nr:hypothetical protein [Oscillospiraceae bacterium OttesenSCG-928-F05]
MSEKNILNREIEFLGDKKIRIGGATGKIHEIRKVNIDTTGGNIETPLITVEFYADFRNEKEQ